MTASTTDDIKDVAPGPVVEEFLEDLEIGRERAAGPVTVTEAEIIGFAERYDPLPMHTTPEGGRQSLHQGIIASGVLTVALKQRLLMSIARNTAIIGAARIEIQDFVRPVRAGDELSIVQKCIGKRTSRSRADRGLATYDFTVTNQHGEIVLVSRDVVMVRRRPAAG